MKNLVSTRINKKIISIILLLINFYSFAQVQNIIINREVKDDKSIDLNYEKKLPGSYYVILEFSDVSNCYTS